MSKILDIENELTKRPTKLADFMLPKRIEEWVNSRIEANYLRTVMFSGGAGKGKTSLARYLANELDYQYIEINASNERGIDTIRENIVTFLNNFSGDIRTKCVIFDECEQLTPDASKALKKIVEDYGEKYDYVFIFITNEPHKINEAILSRCKAIINFDHEGKQELANISNKLYSKISKTLREYDIKFKKEELVEYVRSLQPDIRGTLGQVASYINGDTFTFDVNILSTSYIDIIKTISSESLNFNKIMQWVHDQSKFKPSAIIRKLDESFIVIVKDEGNNLTPQDRYFIVPATRIVDDFNIKLKGDNVNPQITLRHLLLTLAENQYIKSLSKIDFKRYGHVDD